MKKLSLALLILVTLVCFSAHAGEWEDGYSAYERQDYVTAVQKWRIVALRGEARGQSIMGAMYAQGQGVPQDYVTAIKWYRLAAEQGEPRALHKLGYMYIYARGVERDLVRAYMWSDLAAAAGNAEAAKQRDEVEKLLNLDQFAQAKKLAMECQQRKFVNCK
ncbi:MAG: tetratricopeptide repeat protein [Burkholderiales bacterium]|nr:tetratricopeptide repeat protein [Burkholderiales bacterium]